MKCDGGYYEEAAKFADDYAELKKRQKSGEFVTNTGTKKRRFRRVESKITAKGARAIFYRQLLICGTGLGISLAANKVKGIRAAVCSEPFTAKMARVHNNCNILAFGARVVGAELAKMIVETWLDAEFEGGRHQRRVDLITAIEEK